MLRVLARTHCFHVRDVLLITELRKPRRILRVFPDSFVRDRMNGDHLPPN